MNLQFRFQLEEVAKKSGLAPEKVLLYVSRSWISPLEPEQQIFDSEDLARIQLILDLQQRMGVNDEAVPVILHLVDQLNRLHIELRDH